MLNDEEFCDVLREKGVSVDKALERMKGNKNAYRSFLEEFFEDPDFEALSAAVNAGEVGNAFDYAHGLKGMAANLGLDEICDKLSVLVEILRAGGMEGAAQAYAEVAQAVRVVRIDTVD